MSDQTNGLDFDLNFTPEFVKTEPQEPEFSTVGVVQKLTPAEKQRRYREKRQLDPQRDAVYKEKHRERNLKRKKIEDMNYREQKIIRDRRRKWKAAYDRRKKQNPVLMGDTPPATTEQHFHVVHLSNTAACFSDVEVKQDPAYSVFIKEEEGNDALFSETQEVSCEMKQDADHKVEIKLQEEVNCTLAARMSVDENSSAAMVEPAKFYEHLRLERGKPSYNCICMNREKYESLMSKVKLLKSGAKRDGNDYKFLKRYDVLEMDGVTKLIQPVGEDGKIKYFVYDEELYDVLHDAHLTTGHGGRDRMIKHLKSKYHNITYRDVQIFLNLCKHCLRKQKGQKKGIVDNPMPNGELNSRCQVDLIDFQSQPDGDYKFIMVYQDFLTKFILLRPLKSKTVEEVCDNIIDIFTLLGVPSMLQSDNSREYVNKIMNCLTDLWPNFKIVPGKPSNSQSKDSVEQANQDIENMVTTWMQKYNTTQWSRGLRFIQLMKNSAIHFGIKRSPYEAMFRYPLQHGFASSSVPPEALPSVHSEDDLENVINQVSISCENGTETLQEDDQSRCQMQGDNIPRGPSLITEEEFVPHDNEYVLPDLDESIQALKKQKTEFFKCLQEQEQRIDHCLPRVEKGCTVRDPVSDFDDRRRSVMGVVTEITADGVDRIGTEAGMLSQLYERSQFTTYAVKIISEEDVPGGKTYDMRQIATEGFLKCNCQHKCQTLRCFCKKKNVLCNSKCHGDHPCCNK